MWWIMRMATDPGVHATAGAYEQERITGFGSPVRRRSCARLAELGPDEAWASGRLSWQQA